MYAAHTKALQQYKSRHKCMCCHKLIDIGLIVLFYLDTILDYQ
jgi:hypothetical protein